ncbi:MAG TPA: hypothetical protein VM716_00040 [Gemmatimonadales bacterium]|nr:hypothetical protein [Gemmatimonadales bacterium]
MTRLSRSVLIALALAGAGSCESSQGPVAGELTVSLATPNSGADGAILLSVTGPEALTSATVPAGLRLFGQPLGTTTRFAITGTLSNGAVLTIGVPDVGKVAQYVATVQAVAASNFQLRALSSYSLTVAR